MRVIRVVACLMALGCVGILSAQVSVNPQSLSFTYQIGGPNPPSQNLSVFNDVPTQFSITTSGANWLNISPTAGITPSTLVATVTPPVGATAGTLSGSIIIGPVASVDNVKVVVP